MFGRDKTPAPSISPADAPKEPPIRVKEGGKGRATPTRREAEMRNRRSLIGAPPPPRGETRAERKAQRAARRAAAREERIRTRIALANGDEKAMPARDRGPARRFVRDYVDARRNLGEFFMPVALIAIVVGLIPVPQVQVLSLVGLYSMVIGIAVDSFLLRRRLKLLTEEKFGAQAVGAAGYGLMRALQMRRARLPKPQVTRGQYPS